MQCKLELQQMSKSLTVRLLPSALLVLSLSSPLQAADVCKVTESPDKMSLDIQYAGKSIRVYGWRHSNIEEHEENAEKVTKLIQMAGKTHCGFIRPLLLSGVSDKSDLLRSSQDLYARLKNTPVTNTTILAVEHSEESLKESRTNINSFLKMDNIPKIWETFHNLDQKCPNLKKESENFKLVALNPENTFWTEQSLLAGKSIQMKGVDDDQLRKLSLKTFTPEARKFDSTSPAYSPQVLAALKKIDETMLRDLRGPSDNEITQVTKMISDDQLRKITYHGLKHRQNLSIHARKRDLKMVENLIQLKSDNIIQVVGLAHVPGIRNEFQKRCQSQTKPVVASSAKPAATVGAAK